MLWPTNAKKQQQTEHLLAAVGEDVVGYKNTTTAPGGGDPLQNVGRPAAQNALLLEGVSRKFRIESESWDALYSMQQQNINNNMVLQGEYPTTRATPTMQQPHHGGGSSGSLQTASANKS